MQLCLLLPLSLLGGLLTRNPLDLTFKIVYQSFVSHFPSFLPSSLLLPMDCKLDTLPPVLKEHVNYLSLICMHIFVDVTQDAM